MRVIVLIFLWIQFFSATPSFAQTSATDTSKIFRVVDQMPRFPGCEELETEEEKKICAEKQLLAFFYQSLVYPEAAKAEKVEGTVVVNFVVEKDGQVSNGKVLKDIGKGCGEETLRVVELMNTMENRWTPGKRKGEPVRVEFNLPIRFKLPQELEFYVEGRDSIWVKYDTPPNFAGGTEALNSYLDEQLEFPKGGLDTCGVGIVECTTLIRDNGEVVVLETKDYNNLGFDYEYQASRTIVSSMFKWDPAVYQGRKVSSAYDIRIAFKPTTATCKDQLDNFEKAYLLADEGAQFFNTDSIGAAIEKYDAALNLFPENVEFLLLRGQAYLEQKRIEEACEDLQKIKRRLIKTIYNDLLPMICGGY
ncbi:MAG: TonB family protein [Bacteroidota bacterium]